jgi:hypothetical protein
MTTTPETPPPTKTIRLIHRAMIGGVLLFALVSHFVLEPPVDSSGVVSVYGVRVLFGVALVACVASLLLRRRVPKRSNDESADLFWTRANTHALVAWAPLEAASLFGLVVYSHSRSPMAIGIVAVVLLLFISLNPAHLEKR